MLILPCEGCDNTQGLHYSEQKTITLGFKQNKRVLQLVSRKAARCKEWCTQTLLLQTQLSCVVFSLVTAMTSL